MHTHCGFGPVVVEGPSVVEPPKLGKLPMKRSLFGDPRASLTLSTRAPLTIASVTCEGSKVGSFESASAATPETCGQAMDVPLRVVPLTSLR